MIRVILNSKNTNKMICDLYVHSMDDAERYAETYSRMDGIKTEIEVTQ